MRCWPSTASRARERDPPLKERVVGLAIIVRVRKPAAVTFWTEEPSTITVFNGFSFVAHVPLEHYFVNPRQMSDPGLREALRRQLSQHARIFCSLTAEYHLQPIRGIIDDRWVFGGPAITTAKVPPAPNCYAGTMESFLGIPPSTTFTDYWTGHPTLPQKPVFFSCAIASGCYWNKCEFCDYVIYHDRFAKRDHVGKLLSQLRHPESTCSVHLCVAACTPALLKEILATGQQARFTLICFSRADAGVVNFVKSYPGSLSGLFFSIGVESLSSAAMAILHKGFDFEAVLEMTSAVLEKGGKVQWNIMENLPFLTIDMAQDYEANCARAAELARCHPRLSIFNNGPVVWPNATVAARYGPLTVLPDGRAPSVISPGTPAHDANLRAAESITHSGIPVHGLKPGSALG